MIAAWPVVVRDRIVHAFKPGTSPAGEAPFRTLRRHEWVSQGVRVTLFADHGLAGQMTFFSSLNVVAARLARRGNAPLPSVWPGRQQTWKRGRSSLCFAAGCRNCRIGRLSGWSAGCSGRMRLRR